MVRQPWLEAIRRRLRRSSSRRGRVRSLQDVGAVSPSLEQLEKRALLSAAVTLTNGNLRVFSDGGEDVSFQPRPLMPPLPQFVDVLIDGVPFTDFGEVPADQLVSVEIDLGSSENTVDLSGLTTALVPNLTQIRVSTGNGNDTIIGSPDIPGAFDGEDGDDTITGGSANDTLLGGDGDDSILGGEGDDSIDAGDGNDVVLSDEPADPTADPAVTPPPSPGNDTVIGGNGEDTITTLAGDDFVLAGDGNDLVESIGGNNTLNGSSGDDTLTTGSGADVVIGGSGADVIFTGAGNDSVRGQGGPDTIDGGEGDDQLRGNGAGDEITGSGGNDTVDGGAGSDNLEGGLGDDCVLGGSGADSLFDEGAGALGTAGAGVSADTLLGQGGNDTLLSFLGADSVVGGAGNDLIDMRPTFLTIDDVVIDPEGEGDPTLPPILVTPPPDPANPTVVPAPVLVQPPIRTTVQFTVTLSAPVPRNVTVDFATFSDGTDSGGTATADVDYESVTGTVVIPAGTTSATISVVVLGDELDESEETFFVNLSNPSGAAVVDSQGEARIIDDDLPRITEAIDIFLLLDDTDSFFGGFSAAGPAIQTVFNQLIDDLTTNFPVADFAFGVGRFEAYNAGVVMNVPDVNKPFTLNQPIISSRTPFFQASIDAALNRTLPGAGLASETIFESLFQIATGQGFDANLDGDTIDNGFAGPFSSQLAALPPGDIPDYPTFRPDLMGDQNGPILRPNVPVPISPMPAIDGVGFRPATRHIVLVATDSSQLLHEDDGNLVYTGVGGVTVPASAFPGGGVTPNGMGASIQSTLNELIQDNIQVIGLGDSGFFGIGSPRRELEALATLTGAINTTGLPIENNITPGPSVDDTQPGEPLYFEVNPNDPVSLASAIFDAIVTVSGAPIALAPPVAIPLPAPQGPQNDTIFGGGGRDTIFAADTSDLINGGGGRDLINAGGGDDTLFGGAGNDTLNGEDGSDDLNGQGGRDFLNGGAGADLLIWSGAGQGQDTADGGEGSDRVLMVGSSAVDRLTIGQDANDRLLITDGTASLAVEDTVGVVEVRTGAGADRVTIGDLNRVTLSALLIDGQAGADRIDASGARLGFARVIISGGDGNDVLIGSRDRETLLGGDGMDLLEGRGGNDRLDGNAGADTLNGDEGDDTLNGGTGNDLLTGSFGNDSISGNGDVDTLIGNEGNDTLQGGLSDDLLDGGAGNDSLLGQEGRDTLLGSSGNDTLDGGKNNDTLRGHAGADKLRGDDGDDLIFGNGGNDELVGGDGNDTLQGGAGNDGLSGQDGDDLMQGNQGRDALVGGDGNDTLQGGGGDDTLLGELGLDVLNGNAGDDIGATGEGLDPPPSNITIDESFRITTAILESLDGI